MDLAYPLASWNKVGGTVYLEIEETGCFLIPRQLLDRPLQLRDDSIVQIRAYSSDFFLMEGRDGWVGTEVLADNTRVEVRPKCGLESLDVLLQWNGAAIWANNAELLEKHLAAGDRLFDVFVARFLNCVEPILMEGLYFAYDEVRYSDDAITGSIDVDRTYQKYLSQAMLRFAQSRSVATRNDRANRVLATTLLIVLRAVLDVSDPLRRRAAEVLTEFPEVTFMEIAEAISVVNEVVSQRSIQGNRDYYYPALLSAIPILEAVSRVRLGDVVVRDVALRIPMATVFESAVRNIASATLLSYSVTKGEKLELYLSAPARMQVQLEPDVIVRQLRKMDSVSLLMDAKYKVQISADDHYQMASYFSRFMPGAVVIVSLADGREAQIATATGYDGRSVTNYSLPIANLQAAIQAFRSWLVAFAESVRR